MRVVIQRVTNASVQVDNNIVSFINNGLLLLVGFEEVETIQDMQWLANKIINLRIFNDKDGLMNLSVSDINGDILVVSQFTLYAWTKKGNRPSFSRAASFDKGEEYYNIFLEILQSNFHKTISKGIFGANMQVTLTNDGPVTIFMDTKNKDF
jgi:D-tyrosyl-tRNA(Tyr) deacylase